ncbi:hypothetical protein ACJMK2_023049 [Sinanodonta woodiana]|uniref:Uncharacterized protein n=1 Tax=Sinanodonta woodiana TaxID=1069815 RepID=A0ABD3T2Z3_SINWO
MTSTDIIDTAKNGLYKETLALIQSGFPINARDKDNGTPLYWSSCRGFLQISQLLIKAGCDINADVTWGSTPLHAAADRGHEDCVLLLVQSGAEINRQNKRGDTPLHLASYRGHSNIVKTLIDWGADCSIKNNMSKMPAEEAESGGHPELARLINARLQIMKRQNSLELGKQSIANVDIQEHNGYTVNILPTNDLSREIINDAKVKGEDFTRYNQSISGFVRRPQPQENDSDGDIFIKHVQNNSKILAKSEEENYDDVDGRLEINENHRQMPNLQAHNNDRGHSNFVCDKYELENRCRTSVAVQESVYTNGISYKPSTLPQRSGLSHVTPTKFSRSERFHSMEDSYYSGSSGLSSLSGYTADHSMLSLPPPSTSNHGSASCMSDNISRQNELLINLVKTLQIKLLEVNQELEKAQKLNEELKSRLVFLQEDNNKHKVINATLYNENVSLQASIQEQFKAKETLDQMCKRLSDECESLTKTRPRPSLSSDEVWTHENFLTLLQGSYADGVNLVDSESFANRLKKLLESQWLQRKKSVLLDVPNREWVVGEDFILLDDKPLNHIGERQRDGNCSLVFRIRHLKMGQTLILKMSLQDMQGREDVFALARMFYCVLRLQADVEDTFPGCSVSLPYCSDNDIHMLPSTIPAGVRHILRQLVQDNHDESITAKRALLSAGMILFAPPKATVTNQEDAHQYCQARMLKLLAIKKNSEINNPDSSQVLTMSESVRVVGPEIEADFISRISFVEFWEIYQHMNDLDLLHIETLNTS